MLLCYVQLCFKYLRVVRAGGTNTKQVVFGVCVCVCVWHTIGTVLLYLCTLCSRGFSAHLYVVFTALWVKANSPV